MMTVAGYLVVGVLVVGLVWLMARLTGKSMAEYLDPFDDDDYD